MSLELFDAIERHDLAAIAALLAAGADPNADHPDQPSWVPLKAAAEDGLSGAIVLLLRYGAIADSGRQPGGATPLIVAALNRQGEAARLLLAVGADPAARDNEGDTPLDLRERNGDHDTASLLRACEAVATPGAAPEPAVSRDFRSWPERSQAREGDRSAAEDGPMTALATPGSLIRVTPWDELQYWAQPESTCEIIDDRRPFVFRVEGWLEDGHICYGLHGPVVDGPERYRGLLCSIITRVDGSDWRVEFSSQAAFRVGPSTVGRDQRYDFRHPDGTTLEGYPRMSRFGMVEVIAGC